MLIYVKIIKIKINFLRTYGQTDRRTDGQPKTIVRNLTKFRIQKIDKKIFLNIL